MSLFKHVWAIFVTCMIVLLCQGLNVTNKFHITNRQRFLDLQGTLQVFKYNLTALFQEKKKKPSIFENLRKSNETRWDERNLGIWNQNDIRFFWKGRICEGWAHETKSGSNLEVGVYIKEPGCSSPKRPRVIPYCCIEKITLPLKTNQAPFHSFGPYCYPLIEKKNCWNGPLCVCVCV